MLQYCIDKSKGPEDILLFMPAKPCAADFVGYSLLAISTLIKLIMPYTAFERLYSRRQAIV